jgi:choline dehydrogenase-like flavoprotein
MLPGPAVQSDYELLASAGQYGGTVWHLIGTARLRPETDPTAVVDDQLRVRGVQGLRVIDASIMAGMPSANTYASTMASAEKGRTCCAAERRPMRRLCAMTMIARALRERPVTCPAAE